MPPRKRPGNTEQAAVKLLEGRGYSLIKNPAEYSKVGLEVHTATFAEFTRIRTKAKVKAYLALREAMDDWIKKHS